MIGVQPDRITAAPVARKAPQPLRALERAQEVRSARAELKRRIGAGQVSAADVILDCPAEASRWPVLQLLASQRHWGQTTARRFLGRCQISEIKPIGELTERQRSLLAAELRAQATADRENSPAPPEDWAARPAGERRARAPRVRT